MFKYIFVISFCCISLRNYLTVWFRDVDAVLGAQLCIHTHVFGRVRGRSRCVCKLIRSNYFHLFSHVCSRWQINRGWWIGFGALQFGPNFSSLSGGFLNYRDFPPSPFVFRSPPWDQRAPKGPSPIEWGGFLCLRRHCWLPEMMAMASGMREASPTRGRRMEKGDNDTTTHRSRIFFKQIHY